MLLASLPTATLAPIVREAEARLFFDPTIYFPAEILLHIFGYLELEDLLTAALVSRHWRIRAQEPLLWRKLFALEGWTHNRSTIRALERSSEAQLRSLWSNPTLLSTLESWQCGSISSSRTDKMTLHGSESNSDCRIWVQNASLNLHAKSFSSDEAHSPFFSPEDTSIKDTQMLDDTDDIPPLPFNKLGAHVNLQMLENAICNVLLPQKLSDTAHQLPQPNWQYLFSQRQRLEYNWRAGLCKQFRIPKPGFEHETHKECIYSLQFSSKHVVTGSRDKTVRIWDLESQHLKQNPLVGHGGSVLCLQFDESPDQDVIASGGSDADLIIWRFSTGEKIKHIRRAHSQSVLNLRFDDRYLVTCSKDNSIKIWNRQPLTTSDSAYPATNRSPDASYPDYIINLAELAADPGARIPPALEPYKELMCLNGHSAAVNALSLHEDRIASASGDRKIMLWDIPTGSLIRTFSGHTKGIACIQYDGKRIISGSSDKSVRIFDVETAAEVSLLEGHGDLVRTVQADFGDIPGDEEDLLAKAQAHGNHIIENKRKRLFGEITTPQHEEMFLIGTKLPPGAGGNRWSKIVSGSYDETVIIWRQNEEGQWTTHQILRHEEAMDATATTGISPDERQDTGFLMDAPEHDRRQSARGTAESVVQFRRNLQRQRNLQTAHAWMAIPGPSRSVGIQSRAFPTQNTVSPLQWPPANRRPSSGSPPTMTGTSPPRPPLPTAGLPLTSHQRARQLLFTQQGPQVQALPGLRPFPPAVPHQHPGHPHYNAQIPPSNTQHLPAQNVAAQQGGQPQGQEANPSRLFKLQFDSRRIICCSHQPIIIGWDFANDDKDIIEASQFFGETV